MASDHISTGSQSSEDLRMRNKLPAKLLGCVLPRNPVSSYVGFKRAPLVFPGTVDPRKEKITKTNAKSIFV